MYPRVSQPLLTPIARLPVTSSTMLRTARSRGAVYGGGGGGAGEGVTMLQGQATLADVGHLTRRKSFANRKPRRLIGRRGHLAAEQQGTGSSGDSSPGRGRCFIQMGGSRGRRNAMVYSTVPEAVIRKHTPAPTGPVPAPTGPTSGTGNRTSEESIDTRTNAMGTGYKLLDDMLSEMKGDPESGTVKKRVLFENRANNTYLISATRGHLSRLAKSDEVRRERRRQRRVQFEHEIEEAATQLEYRKRMLAAQNEADRLLDEVDLYGGRDARHADDKVKLQLLQRRMRVMHEQRVDGIYAARERLYAKNAMLNDNLQTMQKGFLSYLTPEQKLKVRSTRNIDITNRKKI